MESGTRIRSAVSGGDVIATRSAVQPTATGDSRVVQLVDFAARQLPNWQRVLRNAIASADTAELDAVNLPLVEAGTNTAWFAVGTDTSGLIRVGDCDRIVVAPSHSAAGGTATITPVVFKPDALEEWLTPVAMLESKVSTATALQDANNYYMAPALVWETHGAAIIAMHVTVVSGSNAITLRGGALAERTAEEG